MSVLDSWIRGDFPPSWPINRLGAERFITRIDLPDATTSTTLTQSINQSFQSNTPQRRSADTEADTDAPTSKRPRLLLTEQQDGDEDDIMSDIPAESEYLDMEDGDIVAITGQQRPARVPLHPHNPPDQSSTDDDLSKVQELALDDPDIVMQDHASRSRPHTPTHPDDVNMDEDRPPTPAPLKPPSTSTAQSPPPPITIITPQGPSSDEGSPLSPLPDNEAQRLSPSPAPPAPTSTVPNSTETNRPTRNVPKPSYKGCGTSTTAKASTAKSKKAKAKGNKRDSTQTTGAGADADVEDNNLDHEDDDVPAIKLDRRKLNTQDVKVKQEYLDQIVPRLEAHQAKRRAVNNKPPLSVTTDRTVSTSI